MAVSTYINNNCRYRLDKLDKVVYLISEDDLRNIHIDNGEAYVDSISATPLSIAVYNIALSDTDELDERYKFTHTLTFSMKGYANYRDFQGKYYAIVKTIDGVYWLVNPLFPCKVTYTYTLDGDGSHSDFTLATISNHPTLRVHGLDHATPYECGYRHCKFDTLSLNEAKYSLRSDNNIKYTNDGFKDVVFNKNSAVFTETFDGKNVSHSLQFNIKFDDYKSSWHYNLLEFMDNKYAAVIKSSCGKYILTGFNFGLQPSFTATANDEFTMDNIQINLIDTHDNGDFLGETYDEIHETQESGNTYQFTLDYNAYECVEAGVAKYLLKKEVDAFGNPTGNYKCLVGYEERFAFLGDKLVGTFLETQEFPNSSCGGDGCLLQTSFPNSFIFNTVGCRTYSLIASTDWTLTSTAAHITVNPTSGQSNTPYNVEICNTLTPTSSETTSNIRLNYCEMTKTYNVSVIKGNSCFTAGQVFDISANAQNLIVPSQCCIQAVTDPSSTITNISIQSTYLKIYVPQNDTGSQRTITLSVAFCDGTIGEVIINQSAGFERWVKEDTICVGNMKCDLERKYTGTTAFDINTRTNETRTVNCVTSSDCSGVITRWVETTETICSGGKKYYVTIEQVSYDNGAHWSNTSNKGIGRETPDSPAECAEDTQDWREVSGYYCDGTVKYHREELYIDNVPQGVYRRGRFWEADSTDCGYDPSISGYTYQKTEPEGYECDGYDKYQKLRLYVSNDYINWIPTNIYYRGAIIQYNSPDCGYVSKMEYRRTLTDLTQCGGDGIILPTQLIRLTVVDDDFVCIAGDKYELLKQQYSDDGGTTWSDVIPLVTTYGSIIESDSSDCDGDNKA